MKDQLSKLEEVLKKYNPKALDALMPPKSKEVVDAFFDRLGIEHEGLREIYYWRNGLNPDSEGVVDIIPYEGSFLSMDEIEMGIEFNLRMLQGSNNFVGWPKSYYEFFSDNDYKLLFCNEIRDEYGKVFLYCVSLQVLKVVSIYESLSLMVETICQSYENGVFYVNEFGAFDVDLDLSSKLSARLNPSCEYWK